MIRALVPAVLLALVSGCVSMPPISKAALRGDTQRIMEFIDAGEDVNARNKYGATPLDIAASRGHMKTVLALIDRGAVPTGASITAVVGGGWTDPIPYIKLFTSMGAGVNTARAWGRHSPLAIAVYGGKYDVAKLLIEKGADAETAIAHLEIDGPAADANDKRGVKIIKSIVAKLAKVAPSVQHPPAPRRPVPAAAQPESARPSYRLAERPDDFAIVIGIDDYKDLPNAKFAKRDADAVAEHMRALGVPSRHVIHLSGADATNSSIKKYVNSWLPRNVKPASRVYFYFSGHGASDIETGAAYLVPHDGDPTFLNDTAYPIKQLYASLNKLKAKEVIVALDTCFSGAGGRSVIGEGLRPLITKVDLAKASVGKITVLTAAAGNEVTSTLKDQQHGMFTYFFLKGLNGAAKNAQGAVTAKSLYRYLKPKVQDEARLQNREQTPTVSYKTNVVIRSR